MSSIYLVRHGQAGFGQDDYDVLSELGVRQGEKLGSHLAGSGLRLDALYVGPRRRHALTAAAMQAGARAAGVELPAGQPLLGVDEFPFTEIILAAGERIAAEVAALREALGGADPLRERRSFDRLFMLSMAHWIAGELDHQVPETFAAFLSRVGAALGAVIAEQGRGRRVAIVTSAGPMAAAMQLALAVAGPMVLKLCTVLANTSLIELRYRDHGHGASRAELSLVSFNTTPHLPPDLVTYR